MGSNDRLCASKAYVFSHPNNKSPSCCSTQSIGSERAPLQSAHCTNKLSEHGKERQIEREHGGLDVVAQSESRPKRERNAESALLSRNGMPYQNEILYLTI